MRNYYEDLGLSPNATVADIKSAYRKKTLESHPDKQGGSDEAMKKINAAYDVLSDESKRRDFDNLKDVFVDEEAVPNDDVIHLHSQSEAYSESFKRQHEQLREQFEKKPLDLFQAASIFDPVELSPSIDFKELVDLINKASLYIRLRTTPKQQGTLGEWLSALTTKNTIPFESHLANLQLISEALSGLSPLPLPCVLLLQSDSYRQLLFQSVLSQWKSRVSLRATVFDGLQVTTDFLEQLKQQVSNDPSSPVRSVARYVKLLQRFDQDAQKTVLLEAKVLRERAYHLLDWIPALTGLVPMAVITNALLQAACYWQQASQQETAPAWQMADEKLVQQLIVITFALGHRATPDVELYHLIHGVRQLCCFRYADEHFVKLLTAFMKRAQALLDIFPVYTPVQANIQYLKQPERQLDLMREHLQGLVKLVVTRQDAPEDWPVTLPDAVILYRAYEASVKRWYESSHREETESTLRLMLMETLLMDQGWDFEEVKHNVAFGQTGLMRDNAHWIEAASIWETSPLNGEQLFRSVNGLKINHKTGHVELLVTDCGPQTPDCFRALSLLDIIEVIREDIQGAIFSLDPVDASMDYHPFNAMWFKPTRLRGSRFLETLLATDYLLKFFTVGAEVQGEFPFELRNLNQLTAHLPEYLKNIITDFQRAQHDESPHRFWIETESVPVAFDDSALESQSIQQIYLYDVKMVVKKHLMMRTPDGKLVDDEENHEGWFAYVLEKPLARKSAHCAWIKQPAMLIAPYGNRLQLLENNQLEMVSLSQCDGWLNQLRACPRNGDNQVIVDTASAEILYHLSRQIERQLGRAHHFTPEYIFAQEFTRHYEEFALYFPEFNKLKELGRLVVLVRILNNIQHSNQEAIEQLTQHINDMRQWSQGQRHFSPGSRANVMSEAYQAALTSIEQQLSQDIQKQREMLDANKIAQEKRIALKKLRTEIGTLQFTTTSREVQEACDDIYRDNISRYGQSASSSIRSQINAQKSSIAQRLSEQKKKAVYQQLNELFASKIPNKRIIDRFLDQSDIEGLTQALTQYEITEAKKIISQQMGVTVKQLDNALQGNQSATHTLAKTIADKQFNEVIKDQQPSLEQRKQSRVALARQLNSLSVGKKQPELDLLGMCLWVPASMNHENTLSGNRSRFVYGGVSVQPNIVMANGSAPPSGTRGLSAQQIINGGGGGGNGGQGGGSGSGGSGGGGGRFTYIAQNVTRQETKALLRQNDSPLTQQQTEKVIKTLTKGGEMDSVTVKVVNSGVHAGDVRVQYSRPGHTSGYQTMSHSIDSGGQRTRIVQTAFDANNNLMRQRPSEPKNNLYDVKKIW